MTNFYKLLEEFYSYPHTDDLTLDFFNFLQEREPKAWENLNLLYADNYEWDDGGEYYYPRLALHGWDNIIKKDNFWLFLPALQSIWLSLNNEDYGKCAYCQEESSLESEHKIIVSWDFAPMVKYYQAMEMDGSVLCEQYTCRKCAIGMLKKLANQIDDEKLECFA